MIFSLKSRRAHDSREAVIRAIANRRLATAALAVALIATPAPIPSAQAQDGGEITIAVQQNPLQLDPILQAFNVAYRTLPNVFETLIGVDYRNNEVLIPGLATSWQRVDDLTLRLTLRRGVMFHDGTEMTAEDVVFSFSEVRTGEDSPGAPVFNQFQGTIAGVRAVDAHTVDVVTSQPDPILERRLAAWATQIVSQHAFEAAGSWDVWQFAPVGTGPFKIVDYAANETLVLEAHEAYWGDAPHVDRVVFTVVPDASARTAGLLAGDYDIITEVSADQIERIDGTDGYGVVGGTIRNHQIVMFDQDNPILRDVRIRQALGLAIDRELLVETIWQGTIEVTNGLQWPAFGPLYIADRPAPAYDPDRARALLADAGYDGTPIVYRTRNGYYPSELITAQALVEMWRAVGFVIELEVKESWDQVFAEPGTGIRNSSNPPLYADPISGLWRNFGGGAERESWRNAEFDALGQTLLFDFDETARAAAHARMLEIWHNEDPPGAMLHALGAFYGLRDGIAWTPYEIAFMDLGGANLQLTD